MKLTRRQFSYGMAGLAGAAAMNPLARAAAARNDEMNILCWEGYNSDDVLEPFREAHPGATVRAESGTSDPDMINKLRAGEVNVWDLINVNQPWAREQLYPESLIKPLNKDRFMPYFDKMLPEFAEPYPLAFADNGDLIGMPQRFGPFSFVVNTDKISREMAEDQGWNLFLDPDDEGPVRRSDLRQLEHHPHVPDRRAEPVRSDRGRRRWTSSARRPSTIFGGAKLLTDDLVAMNTALINGEIDAYFTGGTYTASPARFDGATERSRHHAQFRAGGRQGRLCLDRADLGGEQPRPLGSGRGVPRIRADSPRSLQVGGLCRGHLQPGRADGQSDDVMAQFDADELDAIQWDSLDEEMARSLDYQVVDLLRHADRHLHAGPPRLRRISQRPGAHVAAGRRDPNLEIPE